jgi:myosin-1
MRVIGLSQQEQDEIFRMLAVILWLGNIQFAEGDDGYAQITDTDGMSLFSLLVGKYIKDGQYGV